MKRLFDFGKEVSLGMKGVVEEMCRGDGKREAIIEWVCLDSGFYWKV